MNNNGQFNNLNASKNNGTNKVLVLQFITSVIVILLMVVLVVSTLVSKKNNDTQESNENNSQINSNSTSNVEN